MSIKIGKNIIVLVPNSSRKHQLLLPNNNEICYQSRKNDIFSSFMPLKFKTVKHLKPNTGIRYRIIGKWWIFLLIKQIN